jgi:apolipoprotein N-acyltransferase
MVSGFERYIGQSATPLVPLAAWVFTAILLSVPWAIAWTSERRLHYLWLAPLALVATIVPPLGIIGYVSPITAAGYLFPGTACAGIGAVALLPGILLSTHTLALRRRCAVLSLATIVGLGLAIGGRILARGDAEPLPGWTAINTHFGDLSDVGTAYMRFSPGRMQQAVERRVVQYIETGISRYRELQVSWMWRIGTPSAPARTSTPSASRASDYKKNTGPTSHGNAAKGV